jgi:hypothetical protein
MFNQDLDTRSGEEMVEAVAYNLFEIQNHLIPKFKCGYFSKDHEADLEEASAYMAKALEVMMNRLRNDRGQNNV